MNGGAYHDLLARRKRQQAELEATERELLRMRSVGHCIGWACRKCAHMIHEDKPLPPRPWYGASDHATDRMRSHLRTHYRRPHDDDMANDWEPIYEEMKA